MRGIILTNDSLPFWTLTTSNCLLPDRGNLVAWRMGGGTVCGLEATA